MTTPDPRQSHGACGRVAALFVDPNGVYAGLPDVDVWDEARDARLYAGQLPPGPPRYVIRSDGQALREWLAGLMRAWRLRWSHRRWRRQVSVSERPPVSSGAKGSELRAKIGQGQGSCSEGFGAASVAPAPANPDEGRRSVVAGGLRELASCGQREGVCLPEGANRNDADALEDPAKRAPSSTGAYGSHDSHSLSAAVLLYAARYALGRMSGAAQDMEAAIAESLAEFKHDAGCREALIRDIKKARDRDALGMPVDASCWNRTLGRLESCRD